MTIFIVDDNKYKTTDIHNAFDFIYPNSDIFEFDSRNSFLYYLRKNSKEFANDVLLILDWCFPLMSDMYPQKGMGKEVLSEIKRLKEHGIISINVKTILCSSEKIDEYDELILKYDNIIGFIEYNPSVFLRSQLEGILKKE